MTHLVVDNIGREVKLPQKVETLISLVPSLTELLFSLGAGPKVIAKTTFCLHPKSSLKGLPNIGGTKKLNIQKILDLEPDLIIANKEENLEEDILALSEYVPVWVSDIRTYRDAINGIIEMGTIIGHSDQALILANDIQLAFDNYVPAKSLKAAYLIWQNPYMTVGYDTFISSIMDCFGFENVFKNQGRYPEVSIEYLNQLDVDILLWSSEPFPFSEKHMEDIQNRFPKKNHHLVDGEMFSWYGSRMLLMPNYMRSLQQRITDQLLYS